MKTLLLTSLIVLGFSAAAHAQLNAPDALRPVPGSPTLTPPAKTTEAPPSAVIDKMADEAQKSLFQSVDKSAAGSSKASDVPVKLAPAKLDNPSLWAKDSVRKIAVMEVAFGGARDTVMIELFPGEAPQTVANFIDRCDSGFYNGLAFHRAIEGFLVQTGDPLTSDESAREKWGTGGEDKTIPAEIKLPHRIGAVAMARRSDKVNPSRRSNGSQFYVALGNFGVLNGKYTVFGQVISGLETLKRISIMPVDANDCPVARIEVKSIKVIEHKGPMQIQPELAGEGQRYSKPDSARGFVGRFLHRVW